MSRYGYLEVCQSSPLEFDITRVDCNTNITFRTNATRLSLECSSLNQHLFEYMKNLVESPLCSCGAPETSFRFMLSCTHYCDLRQRYFSGLGLQLTVNILLNEKTDENITMNNAIFRRAQLYILATKRFT